MADGVDTTVFAAFAAGFVSFISPCVLPLVPGYLSAVSGISIVDMQEGEQRKSAVLLPAIVFCLSFTAVFVALVILAALLALLIPRWRRREPAIAFGAPSVSDAELKRVDEDLKRLG